MKDAVFWDVAPCRYFVNRRFGGTYRLHLQGRRNPRAMNQREQLAVDFSILKMEAICHRRENLKSHIIKHYVMKA
jgi:hypothetical protein